MEPDPPYLLATLSLGVGTAKGKSARSPNALENLNSGTWRDLRVKTWDFRYGHLREVAESPVSRVPSSVSVQFWVAF